MSLKKSFLIEFIALKSYFNSFYLNDKLRVLYIEKIKL